MPLELNLPKQHAVSKSRAFTLIESLIALVMLIVGILSLFAAIPAAFGYNARDSQRLQAVAAAHIYLDTLRLYIAVNGTNAGLPAAPSIAIEVGDSMDGSGRALVSPGNFTLTALCPLASGSTQMYDCIVTSSWSQSGQSRSVSVESYVTSQK